MTVNAARPAAHSHIRNSRQGGGVRWQDFVVILMWAVGAVLLVGVGLTLRWGGSEYVPWPLGADTQAEAASGEVVACRYAWWRCVICEALPSQSLEGSGQAPSSQALPFGSS